MDVLKNNICISKVDTILEYLYLVTSQQCPFPPFPRRFLTQTRFFLRLLPPLSYFYAFLLFFASYTICLPESLKALPPFRLEGTALL